MAADVSEFLNLMPPLQKGDPRITPVPWDEGMTKACAGVLEKPTENVVGIIANFADTDEGKDYRARYLLRGVITYAANPDQKDKLEPVVAAIASQLSSDRVKQVKAALLRELHFAGTPSAAKAIAPFLTDEELCSDAANALRSVREGATALLVAAMPAATGHARTEIVHALAALAEAPRCRPCRAPCPTRNSTRVWPRPGAWPTWAMPRAPMPCSKRAPPPPAGNASR